VPVSATKDLVLSVSGKEPARPGFNGVLVIGQLAFGSVSVGQITLGMVSNVQIAVGKFTLGQAWAATDVKLKFDSKEVFIISKRGA
jgi:hypothetical protein